MMILYQKHTLSLELESSLESTLGRISHVTVLDTNTELVHDLLGLVLMKVEETLSLSLDSLLVVQAYILMNGGGSEIQD